MSVVSCTVSTSIALETTVEHAGKRRKHTFLIPDDMMETIGDRHFIKLSRKNSISRRIMTMLLPSHKLRTEMAQHSINLKKCDIGRKIYDALDAKMRIELVGSEHMAKRLPSKWSRIKRQKRHRRGIEEMKDIVDVTMPAIGPIEPVTISMITNTSSKVPRMEVGTTSFTWIARAVAHQLSDRDPSADDDGEAHDAAAQSCPSEDWSCSTHVNW